LKTRNKKAAKRAKGGLLARAAPRAIGEKLEVGDRVRIIEIPEDLKDPEYDFKDSERREMRTAELFRFCLGRVFSDRYEFVELEVSKSPVVRKKFGLNTIWIEPEFLKRAGVQRLKAR
jgi:hypothetical protein